MIFILNYTKHQVKLIRTMIIIFKLLGLAPFTTEIMPTVTNKRQQLKVAFNYSFIGSLYNLILSVYFLSTIYIFTLPSKHKNLPTIDRFARTSLTIIENSIYTAIILSFCFKQKKYIEIITQLLQVQNNLRLNVLVHKIKYNNITLLILIFQITVTLMLFISEIYADGYLKLSTLVHTVPTLVIATTVISYTNLLIITFNLFKIVNKSFKRVTKKNECVTEYEIEKNRHSFRELVLLRETNREIYHVLKKITGYYSKPMLVIVVHFYASVTYSFYLLVLKILSSVNMTTNGYILQSLWMINSVIPIIYITSYISKNISEVC